MKSMTGFGRGFFSGENFALTVELKTVNNRFLDISLRLLPELQSFEANIKRLISNRLQRGRVEVNLTIEQNEEVKYEINRPLLAGYLSAMKQMQTEFGLAGEPDLNVISRLPNVLQVKKSEPDKTLYSGLEQVFETALDGLEEMRQTEGQSLKAELVKRLDEIENRLPVIESESAKVFDEYALRLTKKINELLSKSDSQIELDKNRLTQEIAYLADRCDINEEIARLKSHLEQFRAIMEEKNDVGKRLDFLTQELNREANTIASKTNNLTVKENALAIKSEIEKIREQVQNVE